MVLVAKVARADPCGLEMSSSMPILTALIASFGVSTTLISCLMVSAPTMCTRYLVGGEGFVLYHSSDYTRGQHGSVSDLSPQISSADWIVHSFYRSNHVIHVLS